MCRKGRMAHPLHTWRRWHRKVNLHQRRHALASAVAATACAPLVMARGHRIMDMHQVPLVLDDTVGQVSKTKEAIALLQALGLWTDVKRVMANKQLRAGKGKLRNRRHKMRRGPLFVVEDNCENLRRALRNIQGVDICNVNRLNIRSLAPGGHVGRLCVWTKSAFASLERIFGSNKASGADKKGYRLQHEVCTNADVAGIINSDAVQSVLRDKKPRAVRTKGTKANPLRNRRAMTKLNPYSAVLRKVRQEKAGVKRKITKAERTTKNNRSTAMKKLVNSQLSEADNKADELTAVYQEQISSMNVKA